MDKNTNFSEKKKISIPPPPPLINLNAQICEHYCFTCSSTKNTFCECSINYKKIYSIGIKEMVTYDAVTENLK